ncbi:MAG: TfuA-like protein [Pseudomonadota bacterium]
MTRCIVAAGPSLRESDRALFPDIRFVDPLAEGDVLRLLKARPRAIGILDGVFRDQLPVGHKEILWAMSEGVAVYGAASIGALRAAELHRYGMVAVGEIAEGYISGRLNRDSDVALVHGPASLGYVPLTVPMVEVSATLNALAYADRLIEADVAALSFAAHELHYSVRTWEAIVSQARPSMTGQTEKLSETLSGSHVELKRLDGLALLHRLQSDFAKETLVVPDCPAPPITPPFSDALKRAGIA